MLELLYTRDFSTELNKVDVLEALLLAKAADYLSFAKLVSVACENVRGRVTDKNAQQLLDLLSGIPCEHTPFDLILVECKVHTQPVGNLFSEEELKNTMIKSVDNYGDKRVAICVNELEQNYLFGRDSLNQKLLEHFVQAHRGKFMASTGHFSFLAIYAKHHPEQVSIYQSLAQLDWFF